MTKKIEGICITVRTLIDINRIERFFRQADVPYKRAYNVFFIDYLREDVQRFICESTSAQIKTAYGFKTKFCTFWYKSEKLRDLWFEKHNLEYGGNDCIKELAKYYVKTSDKNGCKRNRKKPY